VLAETDAERRVWELLTRDFYWQIPADFSVKLYRGSTVTEGPARLQIFEVAVAAIFARLRPEYEWYVTPNQPDGGLDFVGRHGFLEDEALGIAAAITVGGQCKKRTRVDDIVDEVAGSLARMASAINPTFFVVALSARLQSGRVGSAREILERTYQRNCHILDRHQLEGLIHDNLGAVTEILHEGLSNGETRDVLTYFEAFEGPRSAFSLDVACPQYVLAGVPFTVRLNVGSLTARTSGERFWWSSSAERGDESADVTLIGPVGADGPTGIAVLSDDAEDPIRAQHIIELITYSVGDVDLGELRVGRHSHTTSEPLERIALGHVRVVENVRPRFFERPFRAGLTRLGQEYDRALASGVASIGVIGAGGSGKSRLCEEFALERRRRGAKVVSTKQAKTLDDPRRILADLFNGLVPGEMSIADPADHVIRAIARYDPPLAQRAAPAIRSVFGVTEGTAETATEQGILSSLLLLIVAQGRQMPLIVHLQDLHWCAADVLLMLERLIWQLDQLLSAPGAASRNPESGILFVFEGRVREGGDLGGDAWSSAPFEAFLARTVSRTVTCSSFNSEDGLNFTRLLFENRHNAHRLLADDLLELQDELVNRICRTAGGNPFHTLEQVRLLKELGVIGQNPKTGLLYMGQPESGETILPESVFAAIQLRWHFMRRRDPDLALLIWGSALLGDQLDAPLFRWLWGEIAPAVSLRDVDATDMLWTEDGTAHDVVFRHENYFESIRRFTVSESDRERVVEAYCGWFARLRRPNPDEQFAWARALLELPDPDRTRARALLGAALKSSRRAGDPRIIRRILAFYLDLTWDIDERSPMPMTAFLRRCDDERDLCRDLLGVDRDQAAKRIKRIRERTESRVEALGGRTLTATREGLFQRLLTVEALHAQLLFNDRRPTESADITKNVIARVRAHRLGSPQDESWELLEMEALYTQSCAQAISGEFVPAVQSSAAAAEIATCSRSPLARKVLSTYGTMLLSADPMKGESLLRECLVRWPDDESSDAFLVHVHLSMALVLQAYRSPQGAEKRHAMLDEARDRMTRVHDSCRSLGLYPDAGAAALVRGIISALSDEGDETAWFAQGVAAGSRGRQMEILWRSHINLATAVYRNEQRVTPTARDHALAALEIMQDTLTVYSEPERSPRFEMLRVGMAAAVWMLLVTEDEKGPAVLEQYPALRNHFSDAEAGVLAPYDGGPRHYQWLRVGDVDYMLY
jgi:hypothetical protein